MEVRVLDNTASGIYQDGLDAALDPIGVVLDQPIICGKCMTVMLPVDNTKYSCPRCSEVFKIKG